MDGIRVSGNRWMRCVAACTAAFLLSASPSWAADEDLPIEIEADQAEFDGQRGVSIYSGNAILTRGALRITGDLMKVFTDPEGELERVEVTGEPATYRDLPEGQQRPIRGEAPFMEYFARGPERASFQQGARLWQGDDEMTGERIDVNLEDEIVHARGGEGQRARTILYPARREDNSE